MEKWEFEAMDLGVPPADDLFVVEVTECLGAITFPSTFPKHMGKVVKIDTKTRQSIRQMCSVDGIVDALLGLRPTDIPSMQEVVHTAMASNFATFDFVLFLLPIRKVADMFGVVPSTITLRTRKFGIPRWPQRRLMKLRTIAHKVSRDTLTRATFNAVFMKKKQTEFDRLARDEYRVHYARNSKACGTTL